MFLITNIKFLVVELQNNIKFLIYNIKFLIVRAPFPRIMRARGEKVLKSYKKLPGKMPGGFLWVFRGRFAPTKREKNNLGGCCRVAVVLVVRRGAGQESSFSRV